MTNDEIGLERSVGWERPWVAWVGTVLLVLAIIGAYSNSLGGPFILDDAGAIVDNRSLASFRTAWSPPRDAGVGGRPLLSLSFAANYAMSGTEPRGYHVTNLAIHVGAALVVFALVRLTLRRPPLAARYGGRASAVALAVAALWALHPLQTESVTYMSQRSESLMGLCVLLTLYCFVRSLDSPQVKAWQAAAIAVCLAGMGIKEVMAVTPVLVWLYDGAFAAAGWREALKLRWKFYLGLAATWSWLIWLIATNELGRRGVGFAPEVPLLTYWRIECWAVVHYLRLAVWPVGLVLDYGPGSAVHQLGSWFDVAIVFTLLTTVAYLGRRRTAAGFLAIAFVVVLTPASSVVPVSGQPVAEHRMYLPLLPLIVGFVLTLDGWFGRRAMGVIALLVLMGGMVTWVRNRDYRSVESIWSDVVAKVPTNSRAWQMLGSVRLEQNRLDEAQRCFETGLKLNPSSGNLHAQLGLVWSRKEEPDRAIAEFARAVELAPAQWVARNYFAVALMKRGRLEEAVAQFNRAIQLNPQSVGLRTNACDVLRRLGRIDEAIRDGEEALRMAPGHPIAHGTLAMVLLDAGRVPEAVAHHKEWGRLQPGNAAPNYEFALALLRMNRMPEAQTELEDMLGRHPNAAQTHNLLGVVFSQLKQREAAQAEFERALQLQPDLQLAKDNLASLRSAAAAAAASARPGR